MLDLSRYLLGVVEIALLVGFAWLGASAVRSRLLPDLSGAPAHLTTAVLALALLLWTSEVLGTFGLFEPAPYLLAVAISGLGVWALVRRRAVPPAGGAVGGTAPEEASATGRGGGSPAATGPAGGTAPVPALIAAAFAVAATIKFVAEIKPHLSAGMTGFDSTWYHGPFAAGFFQSGDTWGLHYIAPQFLAWFYPANSELFHGVGMLAFDRDLLSPLLNLGWFMGCLVACWCIGRPCGVAPWSLALGAIALSVPAFADQAGEARNDIVGTLFLLAAVAIALAARSSSVRTYDRIATKSSNAAIVAGLAAGLAAGTKLNFLLPAAVLVIGLAFVAPVGARWRALWMGGLAALAGGGYWYLRNLIQTGNPLPWIDSIGPVSLPAPDQALGGREGHSVLGYLFDGPVWSDWFLPGLHDGLWLVWPLLLGFALGGLVLCVAPAFTRKSGEDRDGVLLVAGLTGLAVVLAWLIAPTSASGPEGMPRGFESGLRYLTPALVLGFALLPAAPLVRDRLLRWAGKTAAGREGGGAAAGGGARVVRRGALAASGAVALLAAIAVGYPVQRHYLENRYASPSFTTPGLNAAFKWSRSVSDSRIATTSTRQYPLYGTDLSNHVDFIGEERPHGGFTAPTTCQQWRRLLNEGNYDYAVTTRDRIEPDKPTYPPATTWTEAPGVTVVLREPPTVVFRLRAPLDPSSCPS